MTGREIEAALLSELQAHGLAGTPDWSGRHPCIRWRDDTGREHALSFPGSPSDWRSKHNTVAALRRRLRGGER